MRRWMYDPVLHGDSRSCINGIEGLMGYANSHLNRLRLKCQNGLYRFESDGHFDPPIWAVLTKVRMFWRRSCCNATDQLKMKIATLIKGGLRFALYVYAGLTESLGYTLAWVPEILTMPSTLHANCSFDKSLSCGYWTSC